MLASFHLSAAIAQGYTPIAIYLGVTSTQVQAAVINSYLVRFTTTPTIIITMVLEGVVVTVLNRFLGPYIKNLDSSQLKVAIWSGAFAHYIVYDALSSQLITRSDVFSLLWLYVCIIM